MSTPLYSTDIIPLTSRPTLTVMDDGDYFVILDTSTGKISKILKTNVMTALKITYDNTTSGLTAETVQAALDELAGSIGDTDSALANLAGAGRTTETVKGNADAVALRELLSNKVTAFQEVPTDAAYPSEKLVNDSLKNLAGTGRTTETVKANADDIISIKGTGYTEGSLKSHEDRLDTLEGTGAGSVADDIAKYSVKLTKMPDGANAVYAQDAWATADGFTNIVGGATATVSGGAITVPATGIRKTLAGFSAQTFIAKVTATTAGTLRVGTATVYTSITVLAGTGVVMGQIPIASGDIDITNLACTIDWLWIGDYSYLANSLSTEASRIANQLGDTAGVGTKASGTITSNGTNVSDGDTVTIAGKTYTFKTILGTTEGDVLISPFDTQTSMQYLRTAINDGGITSFCYCASAHPLVSALRSNLTVTLSARTAGILGNSITLAKSASTLTLSGPTLTGGTDDVGQKIYTQVKDIVAGGTRPAQADISDTSTVIGYENSVDVASGGTTTLPAGGTFRWAVYGYGATISSVKKGTSAGGTILTVAGANATVWYRRIA